MRSSRGESRTWGLLGMALALSVCATSARAQLVTCGCSDAYTQDCDGNNTDDCCDILNGVSFDADGDGIPNQCDVAISINPFGGFETRPTDTPVHNLDLNNDGHTWNNPSTSFRYQNTGCNPSQPRAVKGVSTNPPAADLMETEYFETDAGGLLDCGAHLYDLTFDLRSEATLSPRTDWQIRIRDAVNDANVVLIHLASTRSNLSTVTGASGGTGRGRVLVGNPAVPGGLIRTDRVIPQNSCYRIRVVLNNNAPSGSAVQVFINGIAQPAIARLDATAQRMDFIRIEQIVNGAATPTNIQSLGLDNVILLRSGAPLDWLDCNEDCVDDDFNISLAQSSDCNAGSPGGSGIPDECDNFENCGCAGTPVTNSTCIWCNHTHDWVFETAGPETFALGAIDEQRGWSTFPPPNENGVPVVDSEVMPCTGPPNNCGQFNNPVTGRMLRIGPTGFGSTGEGIIGPRTHSAAGSDADFEFWEVDVIVDSAPSPPNGDIYFAIWDRCNDFTGTENGTPPQALAGVPFTAGVRFNVPNGGNREVEVLDGSIPPTEPPNLWRDQGPNRVWNIGAKKHILIKLVNSVDPAQPLPLVEYYVGEHIHGQLDTQSIWTLGIQNPAAGGDREMVVMNTSPTMNAYFDNFRYDRDDNCDHDTLPDSIWLGPPVQTPAGSRFQACYNVNNNNLVDWCEDCNNNGTLDSVEISAGTSRDCNLNGIPDQCDVDETQPRYREVGLIATVPAGACIPGGDPFAFASWSRRGGGSQDCNSNGTPDECEADCNDNGVLDSCDITAGTSLDAAGPAGCTGGDGIPDECQQDCNGNRIHDRCDITGGTSLDCNSNQSADECEVPDCDGNNIPDGCEITAGTGTDCNANGTMDSCEPPANDCNANDLPDSCEIAGNDCNDNSRLDSCDIAGGTSLDADANGTPDECNGGGGNLVSAVSRKSNVGGPGGVCDLSIDLAAGPPIPTEPRNGGITQVVLTYDNAPAATPVVLNEDATCPSPPTYGAYTGASIMNCVPAGNLLTCTFTPGLENARTYRLTVPNGSSPNTANVEIRGLIGDVNGAGPGDGFVNAGDRSVVIGVWTAPGGFSCGTDLNNSGATNAGDRSVVIGQWTGTGTNCAP